jgi:hypothetical protein
MITFETTGDIEITLTQQKWSNGRTTTIVEKIHVKK